MDVLTLALAKKKAGGIGTPGKDGKDGKSAYQIAVENGFDGTEKQWIESLNGSDGYSPTIVENNSNDDTTYKLDITTERNTFTTPNLKGQDGKDGDKGDVGPIPNLTVGVVNTLDPGNNATASITGTAEDPVLNFGIPKGLDGKDGSNGVTATINIGTITTGDAGTNASVTNTGTETAAVFNFVIPKGIKGDKGEKGDPFTISKTFPSVEIMNQGFATDGVPNGGFVMIDTGDVEDADNAKLYVKGEISYTYITDLSGAQGIKGEKGEPGKDGLNGSDGAAATISIGEVTTGSPGTDAVVHNSGTPNVSVFDFTIPRGKDGNEGFSPTIIENDGNSEDVYKLNITTKTSSFVTPNLRGPKGDAGTTNYPELANLPQINGVTITGNKTLLDLGVQAASDASLETTDKTIVGAINELLEKINALTPVDGEALLTVPIVETE